MRGLLLVVPALLAAQTVSYDIEPAEGSRFALEVFKSKLWNGKKHTFLFDGYRGNLEFDANEPSRSSVRFTLGADSVRCVDDWVKPGQIPDIEKAARETMAAERYPEITFRSTEISAAGEGRYTVRGELTIRGVSKPVTLNIAAAAGANQVRIAGSGQIRLSDFGLKPPAGAFSLFIGTKDEMNLMFDVLASRL